MYSPYCPPPPPPYLVQPVGHQQVLLLAQHVGFGAVPVPVPISAPVSGAAPRPAAAPEGFQGGREPAHEVVAAVKEVRHEEVEEGPELVQFVLQGRA